MARQSSNMGADYSTESAEPQPQQTAVVRRRGSNLDQVHQLISAAIAAGTARLDVINRNVAHVNDRLTPVLSAQVDYGGHQIRLESNLSELQNDVSKLLGKLDSMEKRLDILVEHANETVRRRQRISAAMSDEKTATLRRKLGDPSLPAEKQFASTALAKRADQQ